MAKCHLLQGVRRSRGDGQWLRRGTRTRERPVRAVEVAPAAASAFGIKHP